MRTCQSGTRQSQYNNKWSVRFEVFTGEVGQEIPVATIESNAFFETEDSAIEAGSRALDVLEETGTLPDMSKYF